MSWKATAYVKPLQCAPSGVKLTRSEKLLLFILADYHNEEQRGAWPSANTLATDSLLSLRYVWMMLESLKQKQVICIEHRQTKAGDSQPNLYRFHALDCGDDHEGGSALGSLPRSAKRSLPSDRGITRGSEPGITTVVKSNAAHYKDEQLLEPPDQPTHTHTPAAPAVLPFEPATEPAGERVCVSVDLKFDDYLSYARAKASFTTPEAWAMKHYALRDAAVLVREWLDSRTVESIGAQRAETRDTRMTFHEAGQVAHAMRECHGREPRDVIAELRASNSISGAVEAQLLKHFERAEAAAAGQS